MTTVFRLLPAWLLLLPFCPLYANSDSLFTVIFYNTENFFDAEHDSLYDDYEFLPEGTRRWTYARTERKAEQIAKVLANAGGWQTPAVIGLCEVENRRCLDLLCRKMPDYPYRILHTDSPDRRGVDVALLYDPAQFRLLDSAFLEMPSKLSTRHIVYACGRLPSGDTLHLFACHLPSMNGGMRASDWKRQCAREALQQRIDSLLRQNEEAYIIVTGDMNCPPADNLRGLSNRMTKHQRNGEGTEKYRGRWCCLDQFYLSPPLDSCASTRIFAPDWLSEPDERHLGRRPKRTFNGYRYRADGFSDHYPILLSFPIPLSSSSVHSTQQ